MKEFQKKEEGNVTYLIYSNKIKETEKIIDNINLVWNELIYVLWNVIKIVKPNDWEKRLLWFSENDINNFLCEVLSIDNSWKYLIFKEVINNIDFSNMSEDDFSKFILWDYKKFLLNQIANKLWKLSDNYVNWITIKASANYILRENFSKAVLKIWNIIKKSFSSQDFKLLYAMLWLKLQNLILKDKNIFIEKWFNSFYLNNFLKNIKDIKLSDTDMIIYHEHFIQNFKKYLVEYYIKNKKELWFDIDKSLLIWLIDSIIKKDEIQNIYKMLANNIVVWLVWEHSNILVKYLSVIFSWEFIILHNKKYKLPTLDISVFSDNDLLIYKKIFLIKNCYIMYKNKKKEVNNMSSLYKSKKIELEYVEKNINKITKEKSILENKIKKLSNTLEKIRKKILKIDQEINDRTFLEHLKNTFKEDDNIVNYKKEIKSILSRIWTLDMNLRDRKSELSKYKYIERNVDLKKINDKLKEKKLELYSLEKKYFIIIHSLSKNLIKKKIRI